MEPEGGKKSLRRTLTNAHAYI